MKENHANLQTYFNTKTGQNLKLRHPRCVRYNKKGQVVESIQN